MIKIKYEICKAKDLKPGDLFSSDADPGYWDGCMDGLSVGEKVYIRTNTPCPVMQEDHQTVKITIIKDKE